MNLSYKLTLADGFGLQITAGDAKAIPVVELLARAMMLKPGKAEYILLVFTGKTEELFSMKGNKITCRIPTAFNQDDLVFKATQISLVIAHIVQKRGGILVHGGLAEFQGHGIILAAPGGTGKTTASNRLPSPWHSLSDDAVLIVRTADKRYWGHGWPTWSSFYSEGPGGSWNTEQGVPLKALYFLFQSQNNALEELNASQAAAMLIESVEQANMIFNRHIPPEGIREIHLEQFAIVCAATTCLPAHRLVLSLTGNFWTLIEESLERITTKIPSSSTGSARTGALAQIEKQSAGIVIFGNSMYPTLKEPGFVEVQPYNNAKPCRGDIIYFRSPATGAMVVHRVMAVQPDGLVTRGDNNAKDDPDFIPLSAVDGKVVAVKDAKGSRPLRRGMAGMMDYAYARMFIRFRIIAGRIYRLLFSANTLTGSLHRFTPQRANIKFVFFGNPMQGHLKILKDNVCVGYYHQSVWHIDYPWRLLVDPIKIEAAANRINLAKEQWIMKFIDP